MPRRGLRFLTAVILLAPPLRTTAQGVPEASELQRRIGVMRSELPQITAAAEYAVDLIGADSTMRLLVPPEYDAALRTELFFRAGGPPDIADASDPHARGIVLLPVNAWDGFGLLAAIAIDRWQRNGSRVIVLGSTAGKPGTALGKFLLDNGARDGARASAPVNSVANMVLAWTLYVEFVAAASRKGWHTGSYLSVTAPGADAWNQAVKFRMPSTGSAVPAIAAGQLGAAYLDAVDSMLVAVQRPAQQARVVVAVDSLRAVASRGGRVFTGSCAHYLSEALPHDSVGSPFKRFDWRWDIPTNLDKAGVKPGDAMLWFGYDGYDCPNAAVSGPFADAGLSVVVVSNQPPPADAPGHVIGFLPLSWQSPDAVVPVPFAPNRIASLSSVEAAVYYLWIRRAMLGR